MNFLKAVRGFVDEWLTKDESQDDPECNKDEDPALKETEVLRDSKKTTNVISAAEVEVPPQDMLVKVQKKDSNMSATSQNPTTSHTRSRPTSNPSSHHAHSSKASSSGQSSRPSSVLHPKPPLTTSPTAIVSSQAQLTGTFPLTISPHVNISPRCTISTLSAPVYIGMGTEVQEHVVIGEVPVRLSGSRPGSMVTAPSRGPRSVDVGLIEIGSHVLICTGALVLASRIGDGCTIGEGARLERGSVLGEGVTIGTGVVVGEGEKVESGSVVIMMGARRFVRKEGEIGRRERLQERAARMGS